MAKNKRQRKHNCSQPSQEFYDAVILHSTHDGNAALHVKTWLENDLLVQYSGPGELLKIQFAEKLDTRFVKSLEKASESTNTIIIVYTKNFENDARFQSAINALFCLQSVANNRFEIIHLLIDFGKEDKLPECIPMIASHYLHFDKEDSHFRELMAAYLCLNPCSLREEKGKQSRGEERREKQQEGQGRQGFVHPPGNDHGNARSIEFPGIDLDDHGISLPPESEICDSGVGSASGFSSVRTTLTSDLSSDLTSDLSSLSGPFGIPHDPRKKPATPELSALPEVSPGNSKICSRASWSGVFAEGENESVVEDGDNGGENNADEGMNSDARSDHIEEPNVSFRVAGTVSSPNANKYIEPAASCPNPVQGITDYDTPTAEASNCQQTTSSLSTDTESWSTGFCGVKFLQDGPTRSRSGGHVSVEVQNDSKETPRSKAKIGMLVVDLPTDSLKSACPNSTDHPQVNQPEASEINDDNDVDTDEVSLTVSTEQNASVRDNEETKPLPTGRPHGNQVHTEGLLSSTPENHSLGSVPREEGYLTPVCCYHDGNPCKHCDSCHHHTLEGFPETGFAGNPFYTLENNTENLTTRPPPNNSYINGGLPYSQTIAGTKTSLSQVQPVAPRVSLCNQVPGSCNGYVMTEAVAMDQPQPRMCCINIRRANTVNINGSSSIRTRVSVEDLPELAAVQKSSTQKCSDVPSPCQPGPWETEYMSYPLSEPETQQSSTIQADDGHKTDSNSGPQLPPRCHHFHKTLPDNCCSNSGTSSAFSQTSRTKKASGRAKVLSFVRAALPCGKRKKKGEKKRRESESLSKQMPQMVDIEKNDDDEEDEIYETCTVTSAVVGGLPWLKDTRGHPYSGSA